MASLIEHLKYHKTARTFPENSLGTLYSMTKLTLNNPAIFETKHILFHPLSIWDHFYSCRLTFFICSVGFTSPMLFDEKKFPYHLMLQKFLSSGGQDALFE